MRGVDQPSDEEIAELRTDWESQQETVDIETETAMPAGTGFDMASLAGLDMSGRRVGGGEEE